MHRKLLTKRFFKDNPYKELSAQRIAYTLLMTDELEQVAADLFTQHGELDAKRLDKIAKEKAMIEAQDDPDAIFQLLRKGVDPINGRVLSAKALEYEDEIMPKVCEKLCRSDHDTFIENAITLLARSVRDHSAPFRERYKEIRSPYVLSLVCLVLGLRGDEDVIPWMLDRFRELSARYPDENYAQGPLLALYELDARFNSQ